MNFYLNSFLKLVGASVASYFTYLTLTIYLKRRKYRHIPGPGTRGYSKYNVLHYNTEYFQFENKAIEILVSFS